MSDPAVAPSLRTLDEVLGIAWSAAEGVAAAFRTASAEVAYKAPGDPVTSADRAANEQVCRALGAAFPHAGLVAEESAPADGAELRAVLRHDSVFFVDPLDGTREFVDGRDEFALMIGLATRGRAVLGVVVLPVAREAFIGLVGTGAYRVDASGAREAVRVSARSDVRHARMIGSRSHPTGLGPRVREALGIEAPIERCGSVGVKIARICTGRADLYVHGGRGVKKWDSCAPEAVLRAAGGRLTDLAGRDLDYAEPVLELEAGLCASNGALHSELVGAAGRALGAR